jgi:hypothetical protein
MPTIISPHCYKKIAQEYFLVFCVTNFQDIVNYPLAQKPFRSGFDDISNDNAVFARACVCPRRCAVLISSNALHAQYHNQKGRISHA